MSEFEIGYTWAIYKVANSIDDCKDMEDLSLVQDECEGILERDGHLITYLIEEEGELCLKK